MSELSPLDAVDELRDKLAKIEDKEKKARITRFIVSALSNVPWIGGFISAGSALHAEHKQGKVNDLQRLWMEEHQRKIDELAYTIFKIVEKLESAGLDVQRRMTSDEYLAIVRKSFSVWNEVETIEKKELVKHLLTNSLLREVAAEDMIRLFLDWIKTYHETHFLVIKEVYQHKRISRGAIWRNISNITPEEDSVEADLFKLLIRDLSTGGIVRQQKVSKDASKPKAKYKSAFDEEDQYELTALGSRFVDYTMNEYSGLSSKQ